MRTAFLLLPLLLAIALSQTGCAGDSPPPVSTAKPVEFPVRWSTAELGILRLASLDAEIAKPFEAGIPVNHAKEKELVADCASARALQTKGFTAHYPRDIGVLGILTAKCLALEALKSARPAQRSYMPDGPVDARVVDILPAALAPAVSAARSEVIARAARDGQPLRLVETLVEFEAARDDEIHIKGDGWQQSLALLGRGDFDGDSRQDWLVRADLAMLGGTHRISRLFLLTRDGQESIMRVIRELKP